MTDRLVKRGRWGEIISEPDDGEGWDLPLSAEKGARAVLLDDGAEDTRTRSAEVRSAPRRRIIEREDEDAQNEPSARRPRTRGRIHEGEETIDETFKRALRYASDLLARTEYPPDALRRKMREKGFDRAVIEDVLERLAGARLLNENAMASRRAEYLHRVKGYGPNRIGKELRRLGFSGEAVDLVDLTSEDFDFPAKAKLILEKSRYDEEAKAIRRLLTYGYSLSMARSAWEQYKAEQNVDAD